MFCKHKWVVLERIVLESAYEQMANSSISKMSNLRESLFVKTAMVVATCEKCGKIKKFETKS